MIRGKVEQECQLKPILNDEYRSIMKMRNVESNRPRRTVQVVESGSAGIQVGLIPHVNETELLLKKKRKFEPDTRKERLPKAEVMDLVFKAFEKFAHWTLKGLVDYTQQPTVSLLVFNMIYTIFRFILKRYWLKFVFLTKEDPIKIFSSSNLNIENLIIDNFSLKQ